MESRINIESIWAEYRSGIQAFLRSRVSNADDVEDLLQEILIKTHEKLSSLRSDHSIKSWLFQIAKHSIIDYYRRNGRQSAGPVPAIEELPDKQLEENAGEELSRCVEPFVKALPKEAEELLTAIDLKGIPQKEYARKLGINYSTLKSKVQKSRIALRDIFEECCHLSLGSKGEIVDYQSKSGDCRNC